MKRLWIFSLIISFALCGAAFAKTYGKGLHLETETPISAILEDPDTYIGKTVQVKGLIIDVCSKRGCWIYVAGDKPGEKIQVKVTDGEIVFPISATGHVGIVEGVVEEVIMSKEQKLYYLKHIAEEKGRPFDPTALDDDKRFIRLMGLGAEIEQ